MPEQEQNLRPDPARPNGGNVSLRAEAISYLKSSPAELFVLAKAAGIRRDFVSQRQIMEAISTHPESTEKERALVKIFFLDMERRHGNPSDGLRGLLAMGEQGDPEAEFRRLNAIAEIHRIFATSNTDPEQGRLHHLDAMAVREKILERIRANPGSLSTDLHAYALEGYIGDRIYLKLLDNRTLETLNEFSEVAAKISDPALRNRAEFTTNLLLATVWQLLKDPVRVDEAAGKAFQLASNNSYKTYAAVLCLWAAAHDPGLGGSEIANPRYLDFVLQHFNDEPQHRRDLLNEIRELTPRYPELQSLLNEN